jgi:hypothetical protein
MLSQQTAAVPSSDSSPSLIDRVLQLRQQLGIDIPLSLSNPARASDGDSQRRWLAWSQSPSGGDPPEK